MGTIVINNSAKKLVKPSADAGPDRVITLPTNTSDAITTANDPDGIIVSIIWNQVSGPNTAIIKDGDTLYPTFNNLIQGVYVFQVVVTDDDNITDSDTMQVTVNGAVNTPPTVTSITFPNGNCCNGLLTLTANFDYNGHSADQDSLAPSGTIHLLTTSFLTSVYTGSNPIQSIKSLVSPSIGDIGVHIPSIKNVLVNPNDSVSTTNISGVTVGGVIGINNGHLGFWARGLDATENNGDFTTTWTYGIVDNTGTVVNTVELTLHATDTPPEFRIGVLRVDNCNDNSGQNTLVEKIGNPKETNIGDTFVLRGTSTPFNGGNNWFRLTFGGENQLYNSTPTSRISKLGISNSIVQIDNTGKIIKIKICP